MNKSLVQPVDVFQVYAEKLRQASTCELTKADFAAMLAALPVGKPWWEQTIPVLNSVHLTEGTSRKEWKKELPWLMFAVLNTNEGIFVWVPTDPCDEVPEDLETVFRWAREQKYPWIRFDPDGDEVEGLPLYDW